MRNQLLQEIANAFNASQDKHNVEFKKTFDASDLYLSANIVTDAMNECKLTNLFLDNFFPQHTQSEYHHFTTLNVLNSIVKNECLWMLQVEKRFGEKEFKPFYKVHGMDGYEKRIMHGIPMEQQLVRDAFYISFTQKDIDAETEQHMWSAFGENNGVRLIFSAQNTVATHLRRIYYGGEKKNKRPIPLLKEFIEIVSSKERYLIVGGIATIGFFYLPGLMKIEQEHRLLIKKDMASHFNLSFGKAEFDGKMYEYVSLPLLANPIAHFVLRKIIVQDPRKVSEVKTMVARKNLFAEVEVISLV